MQQPKLLLAWGSQTVIERVLSVWRASKVSHVIVTVHPDDLTLADLCRQGGAEVVVPHEAPADMKASVRLALDHVRQRHAPAEDDVWLLAPADMPALTADAIDRILSAHGPADRRILVPCCTGRRGHPVLFPWPLAGRVAELGPEEGINCLVEKYPSTDIALNEPGILDDLDTRSEYEQLRNRYRPT